MAKKQAMKGPRRKAIPMRTDPVDAQIGDPIDEGVALVATSLDDAAVHPLTGEGIPFVADGAVKMRDGSEGKEIFLDPVALEVTSSFPNLLLINAEGKIMKLPAASEGDAFTVVARNGSWAVARVAPTKCFDANDVCGDCDPDYVAGFVQVTEGGETRLCMVKMNFTDFLKDPINFSNSSTIQVSGDGSPSTPFTFSVKISTTPGNLLQVDSTGLLALQTS